MEFFQWGEIIHLFHQFYGDKCQYWNKAGPSQCMMPDPEDLCEDINDLISFTRSEDEGVKEASCKREIVPSSR